MKGIAVAGSALVDEINIIPSYPERGKLVEINSVSRNVGGLVPNVGIDLKRLNPDLDVYAYAKVGRDEKAEFLLGTLKNNGIDVRGITRSEHSGTSYTQVMSESDGERTFFSYSGACADFGYDDIDFDGIDAEIFHLGYFLLLKKIDDGDGLKILKELSDRGVRTSIDLVSSVGGRYEKILPCLPFVDYLIINEIEAAELCGEPNERNLRKLSEKLFSFGVRKCVIIHEQDKACLFDGKYRETASLIVPTELFRGKTGAGDAFCAGCLSGICAGTSPDEILETGIRAAAASIMSYGATDGVRTKKEIYEITKDFGRRKLCL